jgi:hypothetical protein
LFICFGFLAGSPRRVASPEGREATAPDFPTRFASSGDSTVIRAESPVRTALPEKSERNRDDSRRDPSHRRF